MEGSLQQGLADMLLWRSPHEERKQHLEQAELLVEAGCHQQLSIGVELQALHHALRWAVEVGVLAAGHVHKARRDCLAALGEEGPGLPQNAGAPLLRLISILGCPLPLGLLCPIDSCVELPEDICDAI